MTRAALLVEPDEPPPALLPEVVLPPHADDRAHPRDAVEPHRDERPVAPARERRGVDRLEEPAGLGRREDRRRGLCHHVRRPPDGCRRVHRQDLADDEPVAEHADGRQVLLDGGRRPGVGPDVGCHVQRRDRRGAPGPAPRTTPGTAPRPARTPPASSAFAIRAAKNSRKRSTAAGPRVDDHRGQHDRPRRARRAHRPAARPAPVFAHSLTAPPPPAASPCLDERLELLVVVRQRLGEREEPPDGVLRAAEAHLDPVPGSTDTPSGKLARRRVEGLGWKRRPGSRSPAPVRSSATRRVRRRATSPRKAPRCPLYVRSWRRSFGPPKRSLRTPRQLGPEGLHELSPPGLSRRRRAARRSRRGEQVAVERVELADGVGDGEQPAGLGGHRGAPCRLHPLRRVRGGTMSGAHPVRDVSRWSSNTQDAGGAWGVVHKGSYGTASTRRRNQRRHQGPRRPHRAARARRPRTGGHSARSARRVRATFEFVELNDYVDWIRGHIVENKLPDESMALVEGLLFLEIHGLRRLRFPSCWRIV